MRFQLQYLRWQRRMRLCPIIIGFPYSLPSCSLYIPVDDRVLAIGYADHRPWWRTTDELIVVIGVRFILGSS
jgi:hypothetical protein